MEYERPGDGVKWHGQPRRATLDGRTMTDPQPSSATRISLLFRLRQEPASQAAWNEFAARYGPQIGAWCRRWGLQEADAEDVTQSVLTLLSAKLRDFSYDPKRRFRAWLKTVTR